jgi:hypothetical protein
MMYVTIDKDVTSTTLLYARDFAREKGRIRRVRTAERRGATGTADRFGGSKNSR